MDKFLDSLWLPAAFLLAAGLAVGVVFWDHGGVLSVICGGFAGLFVGLAGITGWYWLDEHRYRRQRRAEARH